jgi:hypothetical protein
LSEPVKQTRGRAIAAGCIVAAGFLIVSAVLAVNFGGGNPARSDFIEYWAAEQQLIHHANPYSAPEVMQLQRAQGFAHGRPEFWYCPPPDLFLALPLAFVSAKAGHILWVLIQFAGLSIALALIWRLHGKPDTLLHLAGFLFAPALMCLEAGQISILFLFGVVLFLTLHKSWPLLAGMALVPCTLKPHLFLPFAVALVLWVISRKVYRVLIGFFATLLAGSAFTYMFDPHAWAHYSQMMKAEGMLNEFVPTLSESFRYLIDRDAVWLQFVPVAAGSIWAIWYFWSRRNDWNWMDQGMVLLLVSALCRPYGWFFDEAMLLPAVLTGAFRAKQAGRSLLPVALVGSAALIEFTSSAQVTSAAYMWTAPAWLACYLLATTRSNAASGVAKTARTEATHK